MAGLDDRSLASFRRRLAQVLEPPGRDGAAAMPRSDVVVLAIDGIPFDLAERHWIGARLTSLSSVFPTTSATGWLSSLTGMPVDVHGVPGVMFRNADGQMVDVYRDPSPLTILEGTIFTDAAELGYAPIAILGDLEDVGCGWRDGLLHGAQTVSGHRFYTRPGGGYATCDPAAILARIDVALGAARESAPHSPRLIWCFVETDLHVHHRGYDGHIDAFLEGIDTMARDMVGRGMTVVAHSDHGLTPTCRSARVVELFDSLQREGAEIGGAGRTRWIYPPAGRARAMFDLVRQALQGIAHVGWADDFFARGSRAHAAVGDIVVIASGEAFLVPPGYTYEHGSLLERELHVPFALWSGSRPVH